MIFFASPVPLERGKQAQVDICVACRQRPNADLIEWIEHRQQETALRPLRSLRGVGRT
jgi:hypothetical protein